MMIRTIKCIGGPLDGKEWNLDARDDGELFISNGAIAAHVGRELTYRRTGEHDGELEVYKFDSGKEYPIRCGAIGCTTCEEIEFNTQK